MKVTTKGQYAIEIIVDLALRSESKQLESLKNIADRRSLSEKYLERIIKPLKEKGIVKSVRGVNGGYCLGKARDELSVLEIVTAVEGQLAPVSCLTRKSDCKNDCSVCPTRETWGRMWHIMTAPIEKLTIADILDRMEHKTGYAVGGVI